MIDEIRPMRLDDLNQVVEIAAALPLVPQWVRFAYIEAMDGTRSPRRIALVSERYGVITGFAVASVTPPEAELESIGVARAFQRQGVGRVLLRAMLRKLAIAGAEETVLEVRVSNEAAVGFYRRFAFEEAGRRPGYYGSPVEDALVMRLLMRRT